MTYIKNILLAGLLVITAACTTTTATNQQAGFGEPQFIYNDDGFYDYVDRY